MSGTLPTSVGQEVAVSSLAMTIVLVGGFLIVALAIRLVGRHPH